MNISVNGPKIFYTIPILGGINITETTVNMWIVMAFLTAFILWLTHGMTVHGTGKRQLIAEKLVLMTQRLVDGNMGKQWRWFTPYVAMIISFGFCCNFISVTSLRSPTADFSVTLAMALVTFILIEYYTFKTKGFGGFFKRFTEPIVVMTPMNIISEFATPVSMSLRVYGNMATGIVISSLVYGALAALSSFLLSWVPSVFIKQIPIFQVGIPAVLSLYFDLFTSAIQAYIFSMLTMIYVEGATE